MTKERSIELDDRELLERIVATAPTLKDVQAEDLLTSFAYLALRTLRKRGYDRTTLKNMVDTICNEVPKG